MPFSPFDYHPPERILLICTQRIGDVLLATPLSRSLKKAWPQAELHFLVFEGTQDVLAGNPDVDKVIAIAHHLGWRDKLSRLRALWHHYDLALATIPTDRARLFAWIGAAYCVGFVTKSEVGKKAFLDRCETFDDQTTHTVTMGLRLAALLGITPEYEVVPPAIDSMKCAAVLDRLAPLLERGYVVLHPSPRFAYKMWRQQAWIELADALRKRGLCVVLTGGQGEEELAYAKAIAAQVAVTSLVGDLSLGETAEVIRHARAFVGPDTAVTHIAAATGVPTVALFGPSNPVKWGPWPRGWSRPESPWPWRGNSRQGNVYLIQGKGDCVPCLLEGCEHHIHSESRCLQEIPTSEVMQAVEALLDEPRRQTRIPLIAARGAAPD